MFSSFLSPLSPPSLVVRLPHQWESSVVPLLGVQLDSSVVPLHGVQLDSSVVPLLGVQLDVYLFFVMSNWSSQSSSLSLYFISFNPILYKIKRILTIVNLVNVKLKIGSILLRRGGMGLYTHFTLTDQDNYKHLVFF